MLLGPMGRELREPRTGEDKRSSQKKSSKRHQLWHPDLIFKRLQLFVPVEMESVGSVKITFLEGLVSTFLRELLTTVDDCYTKPRKSARLKLFVNQMLLYFQKMYLKVKPHLGKFDAKDSVYLGLMSELVAIYVDLELKASKRGVDSLKKVCRSVCTALYVYLDHSENHMAEAMLKARLIKKGNEDICAPVLAKLLTNAKCEINDEGDYARFLLSFKLWRKIRRRPEDRRSISRIAVSKLKPPAPVEEAAKRLKRIFPTLSKVGPKLDLTFVLINSKFDFFKSKAEFLKTYSLSQNSIYKSLSERRPFFYFNLRLGSPRPDATNEEKSRNNLACAGLEFNDPAAGLIRASKRCTEDEGKLVDSEVDELETRASGGSERAEREGSGAGKNSVELPNAPKVCFIEKLEGSTGGQEREKESSSGRPLKTVKFESLAKCYKIVKSSALKTQATASTQTDGVVRTLKHFNFSSKIVKITQEEFNGTTPKRMKSWRTMLKERRLLEEEQKKRGQAVVRPGCGSQGGVQETPTDGPGDQKEAQDAVLDLSTTDLQGDGGSGGFRGDEDLEDFLKSFEGSEENCFRWSLPWDDIPDDCFASLNNFDSVLDSAFPDDLFFQNDSDLHPFENRSPSSPPDKDKSKEGSGEEWPRRGILVNSTGRLSGDPMEFSPSPFDP